MRERRKIRETKANVRAIRERENKREGRCGGGEERVSEIKKDSHGQLG